MERKEDLLVLTVALDKLLEDLTKHALSGLIGTGFDSRITWQAIYTRNTHLKEIAKGKRCAPILPPKTDAAVTLNEMLAWINYSLINYSLIDYNLNGYNKDFDDDREGEIKNILIRMKNLIEAEFEYYKDALNL